MYSVIIPFILMNFLQNTTWERCQKNIEMIFVWYGKRHMMNSKHWQMKKIRNLWRMLRGWMNCYKMLRC